MNDRGAIPKLIILCGIAHAGKSAWARNHNVSGDYRVISSDAIRRECECSERQKIRARAYCVSRVIYSHNRRGEKEVGTEKAYCMGCDRRQNYSVLGRSETY